MKKILGYSSVILLFAIILIAGISGCGSESNSNNTGKKIKVTIPFDLSEKSFKKTNQIDNYNQLYGPVPSNIRSIRVNCIYQNGSKISSTVNVSAGATVDVVMEVDVGVVIFYASAYDGYDGTGNLLYEGASALQGLEMGKTYDITINMTTPTSPTVSSTTPVSGATNVLTDGIITVIFSKAMDPTTINATTFTISTGGSNIAGIVRYGGTTATFVPSSSLSYNTTYNATITTGVKDAAGNTMTSSYTWNFTTKAAGDTSAPSVSSTKPDSGATSVPINTSISVTFSKTMDSTTINTTTFTVSSGGSNISGSINYSGTTATFKPSSNLSPNTTYTATITTGVKDSSGNAMTSNYSWSFTAGTSSDTTPPTISSATPSGTTVPTSSIITVIFSEGMDGTTINSSTFTISGGVTGSINYGGTTATFTPSTSLSPNTIYTITITIGVKDAAGNAMTSNYSWSFTTAGGGDTTPPNVSSVIPSLGATSVAMNTVITATFSEAMLSTTITPSTFTVSGVTGTVTYSNKTAKFTPSASLTPSTYTATITTGVTDPAGIAMTSNYSWSFTVENFSDTTPPTISSATPTGTTVPTSSIITVIFSEGMDATTINSSTFTISGGVTGSINYGGTTATFTPSTSLSPTTPYTVTITTGAKDMAGNALASSYSWSFTTQ